MAYDLTHIVRRSRAIRRRVITLRHIDPPATLATDLYQSAYLPIVTVWRQGSAELIAAYEATHSAMTTDSSEDLRSLLERYEREAAALIAILALRVDRWARRIETWHRTRWVRNIGAATGVDVAPLLAIPQAGSARLVVTATQTTRAASVPPVAIREGLEAVVQRNVALIKDVSAQAQGRISDAVFRSVSNRTAPDAVAKDIREAVDMARDRSKRIAADQLSKASAMLDRERREEAGLTVWQWAHSRKKHPRKHHQERDGLLFSEDETRVGKVVDGKTVQEPPPDDDRPSIPPWCGCREKAVLVFDS